MAQRALEINLDATPVTVNTALLEVGGFNGCHAGNYDVFPEALGLAMRRCYDDAEALEHVIKGGLMMVEVLGGDHFVLAVERIDDDYLVLNPWDGTAHLLEERYPGPESYRLIWVAEPEPPGPDFPIRGVHDIEGADWLQSVGGGWCCVPFYVKDWMDSTPERQREIVNELNAKIAACDKVRFVVNLRYSFATDDGGFGTMPEPGRLEEFEAACVRLTSVIYAWGFVYCNEPNNPREWPVGYPINPEYYYPSYNRVFAAAPQVRIAPAAIDPLNDGWGDWRPVWETVLDSILGADFLAFHAYDHGWDADWGQQFGPGALSGAFFNLRMLETQIGVLPDEFTALPWLVTETNHGAVYSEDQMDQPPFAWGAPSAEWVGRAAWYFGDNIGIDGVCFYRFDYGDDHWRFGDHPEILAAIAEVGRG
jgi:hypothetical protein